MKALIKKVVYKKEYTTKFGQLHLFEVYYNNKKGYYSSKRKDQNYFITNKECDFIEEMQKGANGEYLKIKQIPKEGGYSNFGKAVKREQSKYSGFAMSYAKDLVVAEKITYEKMFFEAQLMLDWMVEQDKKLSV